MPITYKKTVAMMDDVCTVEDAEILWDWLTEHPKGKVNMKACTHMHSALLQVLMKMRPTVSSFPKDEGLGKWVNQLFKE